MLETKVYYCFIDDYKDSEIKINDDTRLSARYTRLIHLKQTCIIVLWIFRRILKYEYMSKQGLQHEIPGSYTLNKGVLLLY